MSAKNQFTIALVGQPNVGKTQLLNALSGANLKVGNFAGVTVEKHEATLIRDGITLNFIDLPGLYSLDDFAKDETVTKEFLMNDDYDLILNVVDSTNLERNLYLSSELMSLNKKMVIALNMDDEAIKENILIDEKGLSAILNIPCVKVSSIKKTNLDKLLGRVTTACKFPFEKNKFALSDTVENLELRYPELSKEEYCEEILDIPLQYIDEVDYSKDGLEIGLKNVTNNSELASEDWYIQLSRLSSYARAS